MNLPIELVAALSRNPDAKVKFEAYSPSHKSEYIKYITDAKRPDTRLKRADRVVMMITAKKLATVYKPKTNPEVFGLQPEMYTKVINQPKDYNQIMSNWNFKNPVNNNAKPLDFVHLFVKSQTELHKWLPIVKRQLQPSGMIWVSWLKKASGIATDVTENEIRDFAIEIGLVDVKICAVSDIWSGLKLVIPLAKR